MKSRASQAIAGGEIRPGVSATKILYRGGFFSTGKLWANNDLDSLIKASRKGAVFIVLTLDWKPE